MALIDALTKNDKKGMWKSKDHFTNYSTGLIPLDFANGYYYTNPKTGITFPITGVMGGSFTTIFGGSGSGKTTLAQQIAYNIIKNFKNGLFVHTDAEQTALKSRLINITGAEPDDPRLIINKEYVSIEDNLELIDKVAEEKENGGDQYKYELSTEMFTGENDKPIKVYEPTVILIDSLYAFNSRDRKIAELEGQMSAGREVQQIAQFYTKSLGTMQKYNISIIVVNHLKAKVETSVYDAAPPQLMLIKKNETLPRGYAPIFFAQNIFRCNAIKSNMYTKEDNGFEGMKVTIQIAKTKTTFIGSSVDVCFNKDIGFDPVYTMYEFASSCKLINGREPYLYLEGQEAFKFSRKKFREKYITDKEFRDMFNATLLPYLEALLGSKIASDEDMNKYVSISELNKLT